MMGGLQTIGKGGVQGGQRTDGDRRVMASNWSQHVENRKASVAGEGDKE